MNTKFKMYQRYCRSCGNVFKSKGEFAVKCQDCKDKRLKEMQIERGKVDGKICKICKKEFSNPNPCVFTCLECKRLKLLGHNYQRFCSKCKQLFSTTCKRGKVCDDCKVENKYKKYPNKQKLMGFFDLEFKPRNIGIPSNSAISIMMGIQAKMFFPNGYGVSVIKGFGTYGAEEGLYEMAVLKGDINKSELCYSTNITSDVIGHLCPDKVTEIMHKVQKLK
jgi:hypothetical protein